MGLVVRAFPLTRPVEELHAFTSELSGNKGADADEFYRQYGISHESWHLQETEAGPWVIVVTVIDDATGAAARYAKAPEAFHSWFKSQVLALSGVDPSQKPLGPPTAQVFTWSDSKRPNSSLTQ